MAAIMLLFGAINFFVGALTGIAYRRTFVERDVIYEEKETYFRGFEDGLYYALGEYQPELFKVEMAESCFKEYKALKNGPSNH